MKNDIGYIGGEDDLIEENSLLRKEIEELKAQIRLLEEELKFIKKNNYIEYSF